MHFSFGRPQQTQQTCMWLKKKTSPSPIYCTHMRLIIDWLFDTIKASAMKDVHLVRFAHSCKNFLQAHEKSQKLPGWRTFAFIAIFRCSLSHLQKLRELREITGWAIFHDTWHFRFFFLSRWRLIRNPVAVLTNLCSWNCEKSPVRRFFAVLAIFAILFHVNDYKVESQLQTIFRS